MAVMIVNMACPWSSEVSPYRLVQSSVGIVITSSDSRECLFHLLSLWIQSQALQKSPFLEKMWGSNPTNSKTQILFQSSFSCCIRPPNFNSSKAWRSWTAFKVGFSLFQDLRDRQFRHENWNWHSWMYKWPTLLDIALLQSTLLYRSEKMWEGGCWEKDAPYCIMLHL